MNKCTYCVSETDSTAAFDREELSFEKEIELSKRILAGNMAKRELLENDALQENERSSLNEVVRDGYMAYEQLVLANIPRAMKIAMETWKKNPFGLNDIDDYRQTAMKVICVCAWTYDWQNGSRFGTYVHNSLKNEMIRENARTGYAVRISENDLCRLNVMKRRKKDKEFSDVDKNIRISIEKLIASCSFSKSLEEPVSDEDSDIEFGETIADQSAITAEMIEEEIIEHVKISKLKEALAALPEDERTLLKGRMGFEGEPQPLKAYVGVYAKSISGVQKKQIAAEKHLREIYKSLP